MSEADDLVTATVRLGDRQVPLVLRLTPYADVAWLLEGPPPPGEERLWLTQRLRKEIAVFDGQPMTVDRATRLPVLPEFFAARTRLYREARRKGLVFATCPACNKGEAEVSAAFLELKLGATPPPLEAGDWLPPPALGDALVRPERTARTAASLRFEPPSLRLGLGGRAGTMRVLDDEAAWQTLWPEDSFMPDDRAWWWPENPAFVALVRLAWVTGWPLRTVEALPAIDIAYLDFAVMATQFTPEPVPEPEVPGLVTRKRDPLVTCPACATRFLPAL